MAGESTIIIPTCCLDSRIWAISAGTAAPTRTSAMTGLRTYRVTSRLSSVRTLRPTSNNPVVAGVSAEPVASEAMRSRSRNRGSSNRASPENEETAL